MCIVQIEANFKTNEIWKIHQLQLGKESNFIIIIMMIVSGNIFANLSLHDGSGSRRSLTLSKLMAVKFTMAWSYLLYTPHTLVDLKDGGGQL